MSISICVIKSNINLLCFINFIRRWVVRKLNEKVFNEFGFGSAYVVPSRDIKQQNQVTVIRHNSQIGGLKG